MAANIKFEETVSYLLAKVTTAFRNSLERHMGKIDLHGGQIFVLLELWEKDGLRQIDIANQLNLSAPNPLLALFLLQIFSTSSPKWITVF